MAYNSGRGVPIPTPVAPKEDLPPTVSAEVKNEMASTSGLHEGGQDTGTDAQPVKVKTEKELEKERKKAEKMNKFLAKKAQTDAAAPKQQSNKAKEKKARAEKKADEDVIPPYVEDTPKGEKKRLKPFDHPNFKAYDPVAVESAWYDWWEAEGFFKPEFTPEGEVKERGSFTICEPPPNVTGVLHMGHALGDSIRDCLIRWSRMQGKTTLFVPGCDHAGISTQSVVETMLLRRENKTRHDLGREKFVATVWDWKANCHSKINEVLRKMGGSFSWDREAFTLDDNFSAAVAHTFVQLKEEGLIYRANRMVQWCTKLNTALSNLEVITKELTGRTLLEVPGYDKKVEFGVIVHFKYPLENSKETIEIATTRPETMLGDTAIAVHPMDYRWKHLIGKRAVHPFIEGRFLPIIADAELVKMDFGTGAVKITPAHDPSDFEMGQKHNLDFINILTDDGRMNENAGPFQGQKRFDVRYAVQEELKKRGLYVDKKDNPMKLPLCDRTKDPIEPLIRPQWWMKMREMADAAMKAVKDGEIKIRPEVSKTMFFRWMEDITDWCLSRQLWWGHQIPMYFAEVEGEVNDRSAMDQWFAGRTPEEAETKAKSALGDKKFALHRDQDVLDTWFSSGLWPMSTLGWPNKSHDFEKLFPTSVLETGWDIIFFWVCRMIMLSLKMTGKVPFKEVYCHGLVRDSENRKMSKSLGNVVDPLDVIQGISLDDLHAKLLTGNLKASEVEKATKYQNGAFPDGIPVCGADAMRFWALITTTGGAGDTPLEVKQLHGWRKFSNKIFQATKYVLGKLPEGFVPAKSGSARGSTLAERWILHKMTVAARDVNTSLEQREFSRAATIISQYWYSHLCDVFIENSKAIIQDGTEVERNSAVQTLYTALEAALCMIHPFMPFISEELWQRLPRRPDDSTKSILVARYPEYDAGLDDPKSEVAYERVLGCSKAARSLTAEYSLKEEAKIIIQAYDAESYETIGEETASIKTLSGKAVTGVEVLGPEAPRPSGCVTFPVSSSLAVFLHVKGRVDLDAEIGKATKKLDKVRAALEKQKELMAEPGWLDKVAREVQDTAGKRVADLESEAKGFEGTIKQFEQLKLE